MCGDFAGLGGGWVEFGEVSQCGVSECSGDLRATASSQGGGIFFEQHIFGAVELVFDAPVVAIMGEQFGGGCLRFAKTGYDVDHFALDFAGGDFRAGAGDASPLFQAWPAHIPHNRQLDFTMVDATVCFLRFFVCGQDVFFPPPQ